MHWHYCYKLTELSDNLSYRPKWIHWNHKIHGTWARQNYPNNILSAQKLFIWPRKSDSVFGSFRSLIVYIICMYATVSTKIPLPRARMPPPLSFACAGLTEYTLQPVCHTSQFRPSLTFHTHEMEIVIDSFGPGQKNLYPKPIIKTSDLIVFHVTNETRW